MNRRLFRRIRAFEQRRRHEIRSEAGELQKIAAGEEVIILF
jgi:hypothetical protein